MSPRIRATTFAFCDAGLSGVFDWAYREFGRAIEPFFAGKSPPLPIVNFIFSGRNSTVHSVMRPTGVRRVSFLRGVEFRVWIDVGEDVWHEGPMAVLDFLPRAALEALSRFEEKAGSKGLDYDPESLRELRGVLLEMRRIPVE